MNEYFIAVIVVSVVILAIALTYVGYVERRDRQRLQSLERVAEQRSTYPVRR